MESQRSEVAYATGGVFRNLYFGTEVEHGAETWQTSDGTQGSAGVTRATELRTVLKLAGETHLSHSACYAQLLPPLNNC